MSPTLARSRTAPHDFPRIKSNTQLLGGDDSLVSPVSRWLLRDTGRAFQAANNYTPGTIRLVRRAHRPDAPADRVNRSCVARASQSGGRCLLAFGRHLLTVEALPVSMELSSPLRHPAGR